MIPWNLHVMLPEIVISIINLFTAENEDTVMGRYPLIP